MKAMKAIAVFILLSVFMVGRLLAQTDIKEQIVVPLSEPGKPFKIVAHVIYSGIKRIGGNAGGDITAEENHNTVNISSGLSHFSRIEIKVPQTGATIDIGTVNEGNIEVENVSGQLEVSNVNGSISCSNVGGSVVANTVNGNVIVSFKSVDPQAPM